MHLSQGQPGLVRCRGAVPQVRVCPSSVKHTTVKWCLRVGRCTTRAPLQLPESNESDAPAGSGTADKELAGMVPWVETAPVQEMGIHVCEFLHQSQDLLVAHATKAYGLCASWSTA